MFWIYIEIYVQIRAEGSHCHKVMSENFRCLGVLLNKVQSEEPNLQGRRRIDVEDKDERIHLPRRTNVDISQTKNRKGNKVNEERRSDYC